MKDVFSEYSVKDNPELDDELDQLANEMMKEDLPDSNKCKFLLKNLAELIKPVAQKPIAEKKKDVQQLDDLLA